ncbi:MAG: restriction endonuclease subunit S [Methylobacter sp.]|jgi:type I restriction enzyme S subunit|nr:restriction endonuclease subunit S [Methylobacter sp.]
MINVSVLSGFDGDNQTSEKLNLLPKNWLQTNLGSVVDYGKIEKAEPNNISDDTWVLELEDIQKDSSKIIQRLSFSDRHSKSTKNRFKKGDVLYGKLRPYLNKVVVADSDGVCTTEIIPLSGGVNLNNRYLFFWLKHPIFLAYVSEVGYGVNMPRLGTKDGIAAPFVLAPHAEQQQIAVKLDELLVQVDTLKIRLDTIPKILKRFRQSVLAAAVTGKLTEDWRKTETLDNWLETNIGQVAIVSTGKTPIRAETAYWENGTVPWLTSATTGKEFCYEAEQFVTEFAVTNCSLKLFKSGTLLLAMYGEGKTRGQVTELKLSATCNQACAAIIVDEKKALRSFVKLRLLENYEETRKAASGGNQPNLNLNKVRDIPILLPPIEEQTEIVHRVEQLFTYADQIEQRVKDAQTRVNHLTQAILAKAFRGELTAQWREQNPELISGENSAEALLARIQTEQGHLPSKKAKKQL